MVEDGRASGQTEGQAEGQTDWGLAFMTGRGSGSGRLRRCNAHTGARLRRQATASAVGGGSPASVLSKTAKAARTAARTENEMLLLKLAKFYVRS